jgi:hypothetical protein
LAGAVLTGQSENQQLTDLVNAAPLVNSPETAYVYGGRELSVAGALSLSYARSSRSTYRISADVTRAQSISEDAAGGSGLAYALPRTTSAAVDFGWSYSLTPRTTFSLDASETRTMSSLVDVHITRANASIGKTLNTHWFIQGMIGVGKIDSVSSSVPISQGPQQEWSGSVGYKLYAHTFLASVSRQAADTYGLGANANLSGNGAWTWKRPGSNVSIFSSFAFLHLVAGPLLQQSGSWQARAGFERSLGRQTSFTLTYSYVQYPRALLVQQSQAAQSGLMATLNWSPVVRR